MLLRGIFGVRVCVMEGLACENIVEKKIEVMDAKFHSRRVFGSEHAVCHMKSRRIHCGNTRLGFVLKISLVQVLFHFRWNFRRTYAIRVPAQIGPSDSI